MTSTTVPVQGARARIVGAAGFLWLAQIVVAAMAILRGKVNAEILGPANLGFVAQLNTLSITVSSVAMLGIATGAVRAGAAARASKDIALEREIRAAALFVPFVAAFVLALAISLASPLLDTVLVGADGHAVAVIVAAFSVPLGIVGSSYAIVLQSRGAMRRVAGATALIAIASTALVVGIVIAFGLDGAIAAVALTSVVSTGIYVLRERALFSGVGWAPSKRALRAVLSVGLASFVLGGTSAAADLAIRLGIVHSLGVYANGLYQTVAVISSQLFLAAIAALALYLLPQLTALYTEGRDDDARTELNMALRLLLAVVVPLAALVVVCDEYLLRTLFAPEFVAASRTLESQALAEVFRTVCWTVGSVLLPLGLIRAWLGIGLATLGIQVAATFLLIPSYGLVGVAGAAGIGWAVNAGATLVVARRRFSLDRASMIALLAAVGIVGSAVWVARHDPGPAPAVGVLAAALVFTAAAGGARIPRRLRGG